jgi:hypothetical protein
MRALVLTLALLAALKIWVQDSVYRAATEEALVTAYRTRAADACSQANPLMNRSTGPEGPVDWSADSEPHLTVGNPAIPVHIWEFDHELWNARFRQPYLILSVGRTGRACTYDILAGTAEITRS